MQGRLRPAAPGASGAHPGGDDRPRSGALVLFAGANIRYAVLPNGGDRGLEDHVAIVTGASQGF